MKDLLVLFAHLLATVAKRLGPGGAKTIVADSLLMKQQILIVNRTRQRAPNLTALGIRNTDEPINQKTPTWRAWVRRAVYAKHCFAQAERPSALHEGRGDGRIA